MGPTLRAEPIGAGEELMMKYNLRCSIIILFITLALSVTPLLSLAQTSPEEKIVPINGMQMNYVICGQGDPLILLHGFGVSHLMWNPVVTDLSKEYQLIIPDLRGHGRSTNPSNKFTHRQSALDVYALLDHLGIAHFKAMGLSAGGAALLHMATQQPDRVEAMVLIGTPTYYPEQLRVIMGQYTLDNLTDKDWERMRQFHKNGDEQIIALQKQFHNFKNSYDDMSFTPPYLSTITARTLIVHGDRDEFIPVSITVEMYTSIPHSYLWILPNGGHAPIFGDMTGEFTKRALAFLRGEWEKPK